jgi:hypothetical protein
MNMYKYTYTGEEPRDFITIGKRNVQKGDTVESEEQLFSPFLVEITPDKTRETKGE